MEYENCKYYTVEDLGDCTSVYDISFDYNEEYTVGEFIGAILSNRKRRNFNTGIGNKRAVWTKTNRRYYSGCCKKTALCIGKTG